VVPWAVEIGDEFETEFNARRAGVQTEILALTRLLQQFGLNCDGPALTR
jgi:hypothetical protein